MRNNDEIYSLYIYYWISSDDLLYNQNLSDSSVSSFRASLDLSLEYGNTEILSWKLNSNIGDTSVERSVFGVKTIEMKTKPSGKFFLSARDKSGHVYRKKLEINPGKRKYFIGGPLPIAYGEKVVGSTMKWSDEFLRGDYYLLPNAGGEYFGDNPSIPIYYELIGLENDKEYFLKKVFLDGARRPLIVENKEIVFSKISHFADIDYIDCENIPTGVYYYMLELKDKEGNLIEKAEKKVYLTNYQKAPSMDNSVSEHMQFEMSEFVLMDAETLEREFGKLKIILTDFEIEQYEELSLLNAKRRALWSYWKNRDPEVSTKRNERRVEFDEAVAYSDKFFTYGFKKEGWRTERGRIALKYGLPTSREQYPSEGQLNATEIWFYDKIQGGVYFYFVDYYHNNNFILAHSTAYNELYDEQWFIKYKPALDDDQIPNFNTFDTDQR
jgi:GWxTD domain-containing protein